MYLHTITHCSTCQHIKAHCSTLQHTATNYSKLLNTAAHYITLQHTATHYNTLQHTSTQCNTLQHISQFYWPITNKATHTATHCNTLYHTATHWNTLQHAATHITHLLAHHQRGSLWGVLKVLLNWTNQETQTLFLCTVAQPARWDFLLPFFLLLWITAPWPLGASAYQHYLREKEMRVNEWVRAKERKRERQIH